MAIVIHRDDPDYVVLSYLGKGEQAFDGGPILAGSFKAQEQGALIVAAFLKELEIDPYWLYLPKQEDDDEDEGQLLDPPLQSMLDECREKVKDLELPHVSKFTDQWLEELMKKLYEIQAVYKVNVQSYKSQYVISMIEKGYTEQQAKRFVDLIETHLLRNAQSPSDYYIRRAPQPSAPPLPENISDLPRASAAYVQIPEALARYTPEPSAPPMPKPDARYFDPIKPIEEMTENYILHNNQTSLGRVFFAKKARIDSYGQAPKDISEINNDKVFICNLEHEITSRNQQLASAMLGAGGHVPPVVREYIEQLKVTSSAQKNVSTAPVLEPATGGRKKTDGTT